MNYKFSRKGKAKKSVRHSLYSIIMWKTWKGAQHTAKRATTVTIMITARFFLLDPQRNMALVGFVSANASACYQMRYCLNLLHLTTLFQVLANFLRLPVGRLSAFPLLYSLRTLHTSVVSAQSGTWLDCRQTSFIFPVSQWTEAEAGGRGCLIPNRVTNKWCSLGLNLGVSLQGCGFHSFSTCVKQSTSDR